MAQGCFLAQYTVRSKQAYIFRTNRLVEVTGASALISGAFELLLECAAEAGLKVRRADAGEFRLAEVIAAFDSGDLQAAELFVGGGNDTLLFNDEESFRALNAAFTYRLLRDFSGMTPLCVGIPVQAEDYQADWAELMQKLEREKNQVAMNVTPVAPFAMMDRVMWQPYTETVDRGNERVRLSAESFAKWKYAVEHGLVDEDARFLDELVTRRGEESLLAMVHADGNSLGQKIRAALGDHRDYDFCVNELRRFTAGIADAFSGRGRAAVDGASEKYAVRWVVHDGDDVTFICNAREALRLTRIFLQAIPEKFSACAGICVFHSHEPYSRAYELAEDACERAKWEAHRADGEECWLDFHFMQGGNPGGLDEIRERQGTRERMARPWRLTGGDMRCVELLDSIAGALRENGVTRGNVKALGDAWEESEAEGRAELRRVYFRAPELRSSLRDVFKLRTRAEVTDELLLPMIYDLAEFYDIWFAKGEADDG